nr:MULTISPECIES: hypothetical protein [unclassified Nonomuraea]
MVKNNTATYPDAYGPGTDLVVTVTPSGFRHDVVIRQRSAKDLKLRVPMRLPDGLKLGKGPDKTPGVLNAKGKEVDDLSAAPMLDAAAMASPDQGHVGQAKATVDGDSVILTAKADFLTDPAVTYPVTVTAASEICEGTGIAGDTHVSNVLPNGDDNALLESLTAGRSHSGTRTHRAYIRFNIHDTPLMGANHQRRPAPAQLQLPHLQRRQPRHRRPPHHRSLDRQHADLEQPTGYHHQRPGRQPRRLQRDHPLPRRGRRTVLLHRRHGARMGGR